MKFLLNMNMSRTLGRLLTELGHGTRHTGDIGLGQAEDLRMIEEAESQGEIILTHDLDYGPLLLFSQRRYPSVILFRLRRMRVDEITSLLTQRLDRLEEPLREGALVVIEESSWRIRRLPLFQKEKGSGVE